MYALLWRSLPGPPAAKVAACVLLLAGIVAVLFGWVFPLVAPLMPFNNVDVGG